MAETLIHLQEKQFNGSHEFIFSSKNRDFLLSPTGTQVKISDLETKVIGIYFSANWYEPCQKFTLVLANAYEQLKTNHDPGFEVVFVSSDEDIDSFNNYRASMPWLSIPFSDLETKRSLNRKFQVETMPTLIFLQPNDSTNIQQGVDIIYRYGVQAYPFTKTKLDELLLNEKNINENQSLQDLLITKNDKDFLIAHNSIPGSLPDVVPTTCLSGKTFGFYFSAQWCSPAEKFTPKLASIYEKINHQNSTGFEIVFVSSDHDQTTFDSYFNTMPWLALPFGDPNIKSLAKYFDVQDIPSLIIIGPDGKTVTKQGRRLVNLYEESSYPFTRGRIELLEKELDEEGSKLPKSKYHFGHSHELMLVSQGNGGGPFICCDCDEQGAGWAYQCMDCGYEVHPKCVKAVDHGLESRN